MSKKYLGFDDLNFEPHPLGEGVQAALQFENGYGVSVIQTSFSYTCGNDEWELAVFKDNDICYTSPLTDDVLGHQSQSEITKVMRFLQDLK